VTKKKISMFGRKKQKKKQHIESQARMHVIPDIFYGGNDPIIYHESQTGVSGDTHKKQEMQKKVRPSETGESWIVRHKKMSLVSVGIILLCITSGASWYYVNQVRSQQADIQENFVSEIVAGVPEETEEISPIEVPKTTTTTVIEDTVTAESPDIDPEKDIEPVSFPRILLVDALDSDADDLTDEEEAIFLTNVDVWDTDNDGYYDGQEVANLYNPNGIAPVKIIDSGLVSEYVHPVWNYRLYYPVGWQIGEVDREQRQVLFSTLSGDFVEVRVFDRMPGSVFQTWFAQNIEGERFQDLRLVENRFKEDGWRRNDGLVAYYLSDTHVIVLIYHPGVTGAVPYRHLMRMMIESFRTEKSTVTIPDQISLPIPPTSEVGSEEIVPTSTTFETTSTESI